MTQSANEIDVHAAEWAVRLGAGALSDTEQQQLDAWLAADVRHCGALVRARAYWQRLDRIAALHGAAASVQQRSGARPLLAKWNRRAMLAAGFAGIGIVGLGWSTLVPAEDYYNTAVGEMRRISLADGSTLILNTDSEARVRFTPDRRNVHLLRGEAVFEVAHDNTRPFIVTANAWQVHALGTIFDVRLRDEEVDVTVSQGVVELRSATATGTITATKLAANELSVLKPVVPVQVERIALQRVQQRFAWLNGMVKFSGESLADAASEINRHNRRQLIIDDAALASQPIVGAFKATDIDAFAAAAAAALDAEEVLRGDDVHLRSRSKQEVFDSRGGGI